MLQVFCIDRSIRDSRTLRDIAIYLLKYTPASCFVTYFLLQQLPGRFSLATTFAIAAASVIFGVEVRIAVARRFVQKGG